MATATRKTAAKKPESKPAEGETVKADTGETVPTDPNELAPKAGDGDSQSPEQADVKVQIVNPVEPDPEPLDATTKDVGFIHVHHLDPARKLPGGTYLDDVQRYEAETARAMVEDREPDYENAPAVQGTPYRSVDQILSELPPHVSLEAEVTLPVSVVKQ
jgi:hypothetical protein